jgi:hypothetical protein
MRNKQLKKEQLLKESIKRLIREELQEDYNSIRSQVKVDRKPFDMEDIIASTDFNKLTPEIQNLLTSLRIYEYSTSIFDKDGFFTEDIIGDDQFAIIKINDKFYFVDSQGHNYARYVGELINFPYQEPIEETDKYSGNTDYMKRRKAFSDYDINPEADEISDEDLMAAGDYWDSINNEDNDFEEDGMNDEPMDFLQEKKEDEDSDETEEFSVEDDETETETDSTETSTDEESFDSDIDVSGLQGDTKELMAKLQDAMELARKTGDKKLLNQLGNTITFFTRTHIARPEEQEALAEEIRKLQFKAGIIK